MDTTHHDAFASVHKPVKACRECSRVKNRKRVVNTCDVTDIVTKSRNFKLPGAKSVLVSLAGAEIPIAGLAMNARVHDARSLSPALELVARNYPALGVDAVTGDGVL